MDLFSQGQQPDVQDVVDSFELHQIAHDFQREVATRDAFEAYCQWYAETAAANRQALVTMQQELDLFGFFWRR